MKFVKTEDLRVGMILAKPIYNKNGVLLYDRNSKLTSLGIDSVNNFGLIGIYILEPSEPLPPMTQDDIEFEKFQAVMVFSIMDELLYMVRNNKYQKIRTICQNVISSYGHLDHKINFVQNLRSNTDFVYKHTLNVAILCAMLAHKMNLRPADQEDLVIAAIVHAIGLISKDKNDPIFVSDDDEATRRREATGYPTIESMFLSSPVIKRAVLQATREIKSFYNNEKLTPDKTVTLAKILIVADEYDRLTAMNSLGETPKSEIEVLRFFMEHPELYDPKVVDALIESINFLAEGCCVELSTGEKALVLAPNPSNILRPMVLVFSTNKVMDLAQTVFYGHIDIIDTMKTLDNRHVMDMDLLNQFK